LNPLELTLGIMTAVGGFVDISELVFAAKAGSQFGYALIWVFALSTIGIIVFSEMSGRVAAVAKQPVFNLMRHRLGLKIGLVTLAASMIANLITCAAEVGGVALITNYLTGARRGGQDGRPCGRASRAGLHVQRLAPVEQLHRQCRRRRQHGAGRHFRRRTEECLAR
jgi:hypothetical protein